MIDLSCVRSAAEFDTPKSMNLMPYVWFEMQSVNCVFQAKKSQKSKMTFDILIWIMTAIISYIMLDEEW